MTSKTKHKKQNKQCFLERQQSRKLQRKRALYADNHKSSLFNRDNFDNF